MRRLGALMAGLVLLGVGCTAAGNDVPLARSGGPRAAPAGASLAVAEVPAPPAAAPAPLPAAASSAEAVLGQVTDTLVGVVDTLLPAGADPGAVSARAGQDAFSGLGTWIDVYDWSVTFGRAPLIGLEDIDAMAARGVQTLYVQTSKWEDPGDVLEPERLGAIIERARDRGMGVVGWYLPMLEDPGADLRRLQATAALGVDAIGVDIEARKVTDVAERNRRLVQLSADLRTSLPDVSVAAIVFPPVVMEVINPAFWPGFPWADLAPHYDVWLPMAYQSFRASGSGYRDAELYTAENIDRMRANIGRPDAVVHTIGGIADATSPGDVEGMVRACAPRGCVGGSLYDWRTSGDDLWGPLQAFRR